MTAMQAMPVDDIGATMAAIGAAARAAQRVLAVAPGEAKEAALAAAARAIHERRAELLDANAEDMAAARAGGLSAALLDRLALDEDRVEAMATGLEDIAALADPVGEVMA